MKKAVTWGMTLAALAVISALTVGAERPRRTPTQLFMRQKLAWSQGALEGITLEKFDLVTKDAIRMRDMTLSNLWFTMKNPDYLRQTTNFYQNVDALYLAAVDKNLDSASEAYIKVARNCVECHRMLRLEQRKPVIPAAKPGRITGRP